MGRPQKFSEDQALEQAMGLFWEKGYHATSLSDLVERTGVCRASLYKTFGDKEGLYNKALQRYRQLMTKMYARPLREGELVVDFLREFFRAKVHEVVEDKPEGCMFVNATAELATKDENIREMLVENERNQRAWLSDLLATGISNGEFPVGTNTEQLAHHLFMSLQGVTINAMTQEKSENLYPIIEFILSALAAEPVISAR